ncbi:hypothetical protein DFH06DRAFT_1152838 [Mycena polygramma]|nr:hypothetical protein DFH06DRAFT_1152838 [Mycena polygramma]
MSNLPRNSNRTELSYDTVKLANENVRGIIHPASLINSKSHPPAIIQLIEINISNELIEHIVNRISDTVEFALGPESSFANNRRHTRHTKFNRFVANIIKRADVESITVFVALVYIARGRPHLCIAVEEWALERVFLGALIIASKYTQESTLRNVDWATCTRIFGKRDIGRIEREFLDVLDWELKISETDLLEQHKCLLIIAPQIFNLPE